MHSAGDELEQYSSFEGLLAVYTMVGSYLIEVKTQPAFEYDTYDGLFILHDGISVMEDGSTCDRAMGQDWQVAFGFQLAKSAPLEEFLPQRELTLPPDEIFKAMVRFLTFYMTYFKLREINLFLAYLELSDELRSTNPGIYIKWLDALSASSKWDGQSDWRIS